MTRDLRRDEPYLAYADFDFQVCCAREGDCLARYRVRMAEMWESIKIIHQALENLPAGPVNVGPDARAILPPKGAVLSTHRGADLALRVGDDQSRLPGALRRGLRGHRGAQRRVGLLHRRRRLADGPTGPAAARRRSSISPCFRT